MAKVLLVEDDQMLAELYVVVIEQAGHKIRWASDAQKALDLLDKFEADLVVLDMMLPGHNGIEVLHEMQSFADWKSLPVIVLSALNQEDFGLSKSQWQEYGVVEYLYKPAAKMDKIIEAINRHLSS